MRKTGILILCPHCTKEFELFSADGSFDMSICWNFCPFCYERVDLWIKWKQPGDKEVPIGIGGEKADKLKKKALAQLKGENSG